MRVYLLFLAVVSIFNSVISSSAQDISDVPPPKPPFVAVVPDAADWTITSKTALGAPPRPGGDVHVLPHVAEVHSTRTGHIRHDEIVYSDGSKTSHWFMDFLLFWKTQDGNVIANDLRGAPAVDIEDPNPSIPQGFPGVAWLQAAYYDKVVIFGKRRCYHFAHGSTEAWIDVETHLPVAYQAAGMIYTYKFNDPPVATQELPLEYQKTLDKVKDAMKREQRLRQHPVANG